MKILYISSLVSDNLFDSLIQKELTTGYTGQKYHGLFASGIAANLNPYDVTALSQPPISKLFVKTKEKESNVYYRYVPIIPLPIIKQFIYFFFSLFYTLFWCLKNAKEEKVILCSLMRVYQYPSVWLGSCLFNCKRITIACDIPWMTTIQVSTKKLSTKQRFAIWMGRKLATSFDGYILLTETMNSILNPSSKPYIVVEGFCDKQMENIKNDFDKKNSNRVILYAGGLNIKYGISNLVEAFKLLPFDDVELWLYGTGDFKEVLEQDINRKIKFFGAKSNKEVVAAELQATILINPRPTTDEYTHYSFPSKTLEYMVSGTYTITTRLAGIPAEYFKYCGVIDDFSTKGIYDTLICTLQKPTKALHEEGLKAKEYVLKNKNNIKQTKDVIDFIHGV